jgi:hypothetical protein
MKIFDLLRRKSRQLDEMTERMRQLEGHVEYLREALGRIEARQSAADSAPELARHEFRVFSQWGEDGILEHLFRHVEVPRKFFVEFGVETYREANTRFLLTQRGWQGLVMDGGEKEVAAIRRDPICWRHHLTVAQAFVTRENINTLLEQNGATGPIGLLSVDVDGNDYWIWEAVTAVQPAVVVVEYNAIFGPERAVTIPYDPAFMRQKAHWSHLYSGASLAALAGLGRRKGYAFVGTNSAGNNAFFVQRERMPAGWRDLSAAEGYRPAQFRESRDERGKLTYLSAAQGAPLIAHLPLVEVEGNHAP